MTTKEIPTGHVCVVVPNDSSVITTPDGEPHVVEIDAQWRRVVWISAEHARALLNSGLPCSLPWKEVNAQLAANLGVQKVEPGICIAAALRAQYEAAPRHWSDRGGQLHDSLRAVGRWPK